MKKDELYSILNENPVFTLATSKDNIPYVRSMLLYKADAEGIIFHTSKQKDLYQQICTNAHAELCFLDAKTGTQVRISGVLEQRNDSSLVEEIIAHPTREFLRSWKKSGELPSLEDMIAVFLLKHGTAKLWTMATNLKKSPEIQL